MKPDLKQHQTVHDLLRMPASLNLHDYEKESLEKEDIPLGVLKYLRKISFSRRRPSY